MLQLRNDGQIGELGVMLAAKSANELARVGRRRRLERRGVQIMGGHPQLHSRSTKPLCGKHRQRCGPADELRRVECPCRSDVKARAVFGTSAERAKPAAERALRIGHAERVVRAFALHMALESLGEDRVAVDHRDGRIVPGRRVANEDVALGRLLDGDTVAIAQHAPPIRDQRANHGLLESALGDECGLLPRIRENLLLIEINDPIPDTNLAIEHDVLHVARAARVHDA